MDKHATLYSLLTLTFSFFTLVLLLAFVYYYRMPKFIQTVEKEVLVEVTPTPMMEMIEATPSVVIKPTVKLTQ